MTEALCTVGQPQEFAVRPELEPSSWPDIDPGALNPTALRHYLRRQQAVRLYLSGASDSELRSTCGLAKHSIVAILRQRCLQPHPDGGIYGWRGLVRYSRQKPFFRQSPVKVDVHGLGAVGAMGLLLSLEPDFAQRFDRYVLKAGRPDALAEVHKPRHAIWAWFLGELRKLGYEVRNQWPFTVKTQGYSSVSRYVDGLLAGNPARAAMLVGGPDAKKKLLSGDGVDRPQLAPFQRVEMDAHKLDCRLCIMIPQLDGGWVPKIIHRLWIIVVLEVRSRAVLGYYLSMRREVSKDDVLRALKSALTRWRLPQLQFSGEQLAPGAALPSSHRDEYVGLCWDETSVDGALAETCKTVVVALASVVASRLVDPSAGYSARRSKDDRPYIERFFQVLSGSGVGRLSNSTGASPLKKGGRDPDRVAVARQFQLPHLEELLAVLIANYNVKPHASLGHRSPLNQLDFFASQERLPMRRADPTLVQGLLSTRKLCIVKGGYREGRRPYVNFEGSRYTNETLGSRHDLVGDHVWVVNHLEDDARVAMCSTEKGSSLGILRAGPPWHGLPHTLAIRSAIRSMIHLRMFALGSGTDAVVALIDYCESQPGAKLPVHPTYLAVQRLLAEHVVERNQAEDVNLAKERLAERAEVELVGAPDRAGAPGSPIGDSLQRTVARRSGDQHLALGRAARGAIQPPSPAPDKATTAKPLSMPRMAANKPHS